jgi:hypothetical protein
MSRLPPETANKAHDSASLVVPSAKGVSSRLMPLAEMSLQVMHHSMNNASPAVRGTLSVQRLSDSDIQSRSHV